MYYREFTVHKSHFNQQSAHICEKRSKPAMGDRREQLKKKLGISEYPWSTDEEDGDSPVTTQPITSANDIAQMIRTHSSTQPQPSTSSTSNAAQSIASPQLQNASVVTSGQQTSPTDHDRALLSRRATRTDRDLFWSLVCNNRRPVGPISRDSRAADGIRARSESARTTNPSSRDQDILHTRLSIYDKRRILALKKNSRNLGHHRINNAPFSNVFTSRGPPPRNPGIANFFHQLNTPPMEMGMRSSDREPVMRAVDPQRTHHDPHRPRDRIICQVERPRDLSTRHHPMSRIYDDAQPSTSSGISRPNRFLYYGEAMAAAAAASATTATIGNINRSGSDGALHSLSTTAEDSDDVDVEVPRRTSRDAVIILDSPLATGMSLEDVLEIEPAQEATEEQAEPEPDPEANQPTTETVQNPVDEQIENPTQSEQGPADRPIKRKKTEAKTETVKPETVSDLNQSLLRLLECPVCLECMEPPMSQCRRGHLVCVSCRSRLSACPVCRTAFSSVRNRAMEGVSEIVRYPCRHGCGREVRLRRRTSHEASCPRRRYPCPAPACLGRVNVTRTELDQHLQAKHAEMVKTGRKQKFAVRVNEEQHENWIVMALDEMFNVRIDVDIRNWELTIYVAYVGPKNNAKAYAYDVTVFGKYHGRKSVYTRTTHNDLESVTANVGRKDCFYLTLDQAMNFLRTKNRDSETILDVNVKISKIENEDREDSGDS